jgi:hypothetical protein
MGLSWVLDPQTSLLAAYGRHANTEAERDRSLACIIGHVVSTNAL